MLTFRNTNVFFFLLTTGWIILSVWMPVNRLTGIILPVAYLSLLAYGAFDIHSGFYLKLTNVFRTDKKEIFLTFDDGPDPDITPQILDILKNFRTTATFFCIGKKIAGNESIMKRMTDEGHIIGNHTWSHHISVDFMPARAFCNELKKTSELIFAITGTKPVFFRPPFGITNPSIAKAVKRQGLTSIGWSVRSLDGNLSISSEKIYQRVIRRIKPGCIVVFHDVNPHTPYILEQFMLWLEEQQYKVVPLNLLNQYRPT